MSVHTFKTLIYGLVFLGCQSAASQELNLREISLIQVQDNVTDLCVIDNYAFIAGGSQVQIIDISEAAAPQRIGTIRAGGGVSCVFVSGSFAYAGVRETGFEEFNISNARHPFQVGVWSQLDNPAIECIFVIGGRAYVADMNSGLHSVNLADQRYVTNRIYGINCPGYIAACDNYAYISCMDEGLSVVNISNPPNECRVGCCGFQGEPAGMVVCDDYVYLADGSYGLRIIDAETRERPGLLASCEVEGGISRLFVDGNDAYGINQNILCCVNVSNPRNPEFQGTYDPADYSLNDISIRDGNVMLLMSSGESGYLRILEPNGHSVDRQWQGSPADVTLMQAYPNPFNSRVRISLNNIWSDQVRLDVYDLAGRRVAGLHSGRLNPGINNLVWDASDRNSGVYLVRLRAGERSQSMFVNFIR